jgi:voltage-gated potassium channel
MFTDLRELAESHRSESLRDRLWRIIFLAETPAGRGFDVALLWLIGASVLVVMLESVADYKARWGQLFLTLEWTFTILFTIEYAVRLIVVRRRVEYATSFFGVVDALSIIPTYLTLILPGAQFLVVVRVLRLMRVFRILKMIRHVSQANLLMRAMKASSTKITVFLLFILTVTLILGTLMYIVEGVIAGNSGFSSVPQSVYWCIVTISTVGYGDITPVTALGKAIATFVILIGYGTIAVPTGIVTAELSLTRAQSGQNTIACPSCGTDHHSDGARFCHRCGLEISSS